MKNNEISVAVECLLTMMVTKLPLFLCYHHFMLPHSSFGLLVLEKFYECPNYRPHRDCIASITLNWSSDSEFLAHMRCILARVLKCLTSFYIIQNCCLENPQWFVFLSFYWFAHVWSCFVLQLFCSLTTVGFVCCMYSKHFYRQCHLHTIDFSKNSGDPTSRPKISNPHWLWSARPGGCEHHITPPTNL